MNGSMLFVFFFFFRIFQSRLKIKRWFQVHGLIGSRMIETQCLQSGQSWKCVIAKAVHQSNTLNRSPWCEALDALLYNVSPGCGLRSPLQRKYAELQLEKKTMSSSRSFFSSHLFCFLNVSESSIHSQFCASCWLEHVLPRAHDDIIDDLPFPGETFPEDIACWSCTCLRLAAICFSMGASYDHLHV